jgi:hypothetical protein
MKLPETICVFGSEYEVKLVRKVLKDQDGNLSDSLLLVDKKQILISEYTLKKDRTELFLHELLHAALWEQGSSRHMSADFEETLVDGLAKYLSKTFKFRMITK